MNMLRKLMVLAMVFGMAAAFCGCEEKSTSEKAGDAVQEGVQNVQDGASNAAKEGSKALDDLSKSLKK